MVLYFKNPVFKKGRNVTVRRGVKWDVGPKEEIYIVDVNNPFIGDRLHVVDRDNILHVVDIETKVLPFRQISQSDLNDEHDPDCRTWLGLFNIMKDAYSGFSVNEIVTVVSFNV